MGKLGAELDPESPLPSLFLPGEKRGLDPITRLCFLKAHESGQVTQDPGKMGDIIQSYYEKLWTRDEDVADTH